VHATTEHDTKQTDQAAFPTHRSDSKPEAKPASNINLTKSHPNPTTTHNPSQHLHNGMSMSIHTNLFQSSESPIPSRCSNLSIHNSSKHFQQTPSNLSIPQVQTPQQRRANEAYAKSEAAKRGKPQTEVERIMEKKKAAKLSAAQKSPVSKVWLCKFIFLFPSWRDWGEGRLCTGGGQERLFPGMDVLKRKGQKKRRCSC
jgi:hypothetical protein